MALKTFLPIVISIENVATWEFMLIHLSGCSVQNILVESQNKVKFAQNIIYKCFMWMFCKLAINVHMVWN